MQEEWRAIPGWWGLYDVSNFGRVRSWRRGVGARGGGKAETLETPRIKALYCPNGKVVWVNLARQGLNQMVRVDHAVLSAFQGVPVLTVHKLVPFHLDGDPQNNRLDNLEWRPKGWIKGKDFD